MKISPWNPPYLALKIVIELAYNRCGLIISNVKYNPEGTEYGASSFLLDGHSIEHRVSKVTPKKAGQFVAIWKRNENGITEPFDSSDKIDFIVITSRSGNDIGQFVFPKSVLIKQGIMSHNRKGGKRGMRVYPPWDIAPNLQAGKSQSWQVKYFFLINDEITANPRLVRSMFSRIGEEGH